MLVAKCEQKKHKAPEERHIVSLLRSFKKTYRPISTNMPLLWS
jgi:hypothetical protein